MSITRAVAMVLLLAAFQVAAEDKLDLDTSTVTGNRELPKVMVIVPWKKAEPGELRGRPLNSLLDEAMAPVDREVFRRRLTYYQGLQAEAGNHEEKVTEE